MKEVYLKASVRKNVGHGHNVLTLLTLQHAPSHNAHTSFCLNVREKKEKKTWSVNSNHRAHQDAQTNVV